MIDEGCVRVRQRGYIEQIYKDIRKGVLSDE